MIEGIIQKVFKKYGSDSDFPFVNTILNNLQQELIAEIEQLGCAICKSGLDLPSDHVIRKIDLIGAKQE